MYNDSSLGNLKKPLYPNLGKTKVMRVPESVFNQCTLILSEFDRIAAATGVKRVAHIADKIIEGLEAVDDN